MLQAITPIDGRYNDKVKELIPYFSEAALIKYRIFVEIEYFVRLCDVLPELFSVTPEHIKSLRTRISKLDMADLEYIKSIESTTNHDVKAVEYFIKDIFDQIGLSEHKEFVHFGLTSQDINNMAYPLMMKDCHEKVMIPIIDSVINKLNDLYRLWVEVPMLARTHGQVATPTKLGKEILVFIKRIESAFIILNEVPFSCKFGGATGNFNAHYVAYPKINWNRFADNFAKDLGLLRSYPTTQIEHYDHMAAYFDATKRINTILIDLSRDFWQYISMNYFTQKVNANEVGSSAMPHKVNPIDFENAEGNLGMANAIFEHLSAKLPISRLQRDLTDSTVMRNIGVPMAHTIISLKSLLKGLQKIDANFDVILSDLDNNWQVVAEAIQTILRREKVDKPYEKLKALTRGEKVTQETIADFIKALDIKDEVKEEMLKITPRTYTGL